MKYLYLLLLSILSCKFASAQSFPASFSGGFKEPPALSSKIFPCSNGNTLLFSFMDGGDGIAVRCFGRDHHQTGNVTIHQSSLYDNKGIIRAHIPALFESAGRVSLFLELSQDKVPALYRIDVDPANGQVMAEHKMQEISDYVPDKPFVRLTGTATPQAFYIAHRAGADHYAVLSFNGLALNNPERITVSMYNAAHKMTRRTAYDNESTVKEEAHFMGFCMEDHDQPLLCTYLYNDKKEEHPEDLYLSRFTTSGAEHHAANLHHDFRNTAAAMQYNDRKQRIELLTLTYLENKKRTATTNTYRTTLSFFDAHTLSLIASANPGTAPVSKAKSNLAGKEKEFSGIPMALHMDQDGNISIALSDMQIGIGTVGNAIITTTVRKCYLEDAGIMQITDSLRGTTGVYIPFRQDVKMMVPPFAINRRQDAQLSFQRKFYLEAYIDPGYHGYDYITTAKGQYVIFNDHDDNISKHGWQKRQNVVALGETNAMCYDLHDGRLQPAYLLGKPDSNFERRFINIGASDFDPVTGTYTALIVEKNDQGKQAKLAWITFPH